MVPLHVDQAGCATAAPEAKEAKGRRGLVRTPGYHPELLIINGETTGLGCPYFRKPPRLSTYVCIYIYITNQYMYTYTGWWLKNPSEQYDFVSWDDEIPN